MANPGRVVTPAPVGPGERDDRVLFRSPLLRQSCWRGGAPGYQANVWFNSVRFLNNSGGIRGGAVQLEMEANVRFTNCEFSGNSAQSGAAASIADGASPVFDKWTSRATAPPRAAPSTWMATRGAT